MRTCDRIEGGFRVPFLYPQTASDVSGDREGRAMDERVRWVTKAGAAEELEISLSTLDRKIRRGGERGC